MINNQEQNLAKFKVVFLGDEMVGKTSILDRYINDIISDQYKPTIGIDFISKTINIEGQNVKLQIWDTAGQERFRSLIPSYIRDSKAAVLCYDVENLQSFQNIKRWLDYVNDVRECDVLKILVANKIDVNQKRAVNLDLGVSFAKNNNMLYYECSAKEGINISTLFKDIAIKLLSESTQAAPQQENTPQSQAIPKQESKTQQQIPSVQPNSVEQISKFKVVFLGDEAVGKTSIIEKYVMNSINKEYKPTIGIDFVSKAINIDGQSVRIQIWDTAGQERFRALIPSYIKDSKAYILIFDVTNFQSFQNIPIWIDLVKENGRKDAALVLIANKVDLKQNRVVSEDIGTQFAYDNKMIYFESSIQNGNGLTQIFFELSKQLLGQFSAPHQQKQAQ